MANFDSSTKKTTKKLIISGNLAELYIYEKPLYFNYPAPTPTTDNVSQLQKKEDQIEQRRFFSVKRSRDRIRRLINSNSFQYSTHVPKFVTLTFKDNITDLKQARYFFDLYNKRLQRLFPHLKYLGVAEIQPQRFQKYNVKVWHFHVIYFNLPYDKDIKKLLKKTWTFGFSKINAIEHVKNIGAYVSKYLRKDLYEPQLFSQKCFFTSKGLIQPTEYKSLSTVNTHLQKLNYKVEYETEYLSNTNGNIKYIVLQKL